MRKLKMCVNAFGISDNIQLLVEYPNLPSICKRLFTDSVNIGFHLVYTVYKHRKNFNVI